MIKCKNCDVTIRRSEGKRGLIYCSNLCQNDYRFKSLVNKWLSGEDKGWTGKNRSLKRFVRKYLKQTRGSACEECGWDKHHPIDNRSMTEIDHIDGDAENCTINNLKILCPNCHSLTPTYKTRNKKSKRIRK